MGLKVKPKDTSSTLLPTSIRIGNTCYKVGLTDALPMSVIVGRISYGDKTIKLAKRSGRPLRRRSAKAKMATFWHEVVHGILHDMGSRKERDEAFVDGIAKRIAQVIHSAKFGEQSHT
jgi:hypothetical protein